jgi:hypothetical protein
MTKKTRANKRTPVKRKVLPGPRRIGPGDQIIPVLPNTRMWVRSDGTTSFEPPEGMEHLWGSAMARDDE